MDCMGMPLKTQKTTSAHNFLLGKVQFISRVHFEFSDTAGKHAAYEPANLGLLARTVSSPLKAKLFHSQTHLGKHFVCWFCLHYSQSLAQSGDLYEENKHCA